MSLINPSIYSSIQSELKFKKTQTNEDFPKRLIEAFDNNKPNNNLLSEFIKLYFKNKKKRII